jgi:type IV secretory pathway VirB3-like protein
MDKEEEKEEQTTNKEEQTTNEEEQTTNKEEQTTNEEEPFINKNIIRQVNKYIQPYLHLRLFDIAIGMYYSFIHVIIIIISGIILLFSNNLIYLACLLIIISFDAFSIVMLHDCPLTQLEQKYLKRSGRYNRTQKFLNAGIMYECLHEYEHQIELLVNVWSMIACKMLILMGLKMFNININIY